MDTDTCLDDGLLLKLSEGGLSPDEEARAKAHLDRCRECRELFAAVARTDEPEEPAPVVHPNHLRPGDVVAGKYRIDHRLGTGGMACVMAATHVTLDRPVAIKFLIDRDPSARGRFEREARALVKLKSPYVVGVIDVDKLADGSPFMVMELLQGRDLGEQLELQPMLPVDEAIGYILELCLGLEAAHANGIVHRDLKPHNIFLSKENDGTRVRLIDFGLAKTSFTEELTRTRDFLGTPNYMAPEQIADARDADPRTDVWSVGACLYRMLAGESPFQDTTVAGICQRVLHEEPRRLDARRHDLPAGLANIVHRCLRKTPSERYPSIAALASALRGLKSRPRERRVWPLAVAAAALIGVGALAMSLSTGSRRAETKSVSSTSAAAAVPAAPPSLVEATAAPEDEAPAVMTPTVNVPSRANRPPASTRALVPAKPAASPPRLYDRY